MKDRRFDVERSSVRVGGMALPYLAIGWKEDLGHKAEDRFGGVGWRVGCGDAVEMRSCGHGDLRYRERGRRSIGGVSTYVGQIGKRNR